MRSGDVQARAFVLKRHAAQFLHTVRWDYARYILVSPDHSTTPIASLPYPQDEVACADTATQELDLSIGFASGGGYR